MMVWQKDPGPEHSQDQGNNNGPQTIQVVWTLSPLHWWRRDREGGEFQISSGPHLGRPHLVHKHLSSGGEGTTKTVLSQAVASGPPPSKTSTAPPSRASWLTAVLWRTGEPAAGGEAAEWVIGTTTPPPLRDIQTPAKSQSSKVITPHTLDSPFSPPSHLEDTTGH